jgi:SAM-dependent methyltransferase
MDDVQSIYRTRFSGLDAYRNRVWRALVRGYFQQWVKKSDTVLDLGAGYCEFINTIQCAKKYALDLNPDTKIHAHKDVEVILQDSNAPWPLQENSLDVVFTSNFFEHLPNKEILADTLGKVERYLKPGGVLIAMGPNIRYSPGAYWDFWDHHIALGDYSMSEILLQKGFIVERRISRFMPFTMVGGPKYPIFFVSLYLRVPLAWRIFGKQFLVVARKPR